MKEKKNASVNNITRIRIILFFIADLRKSKFIHCIKIQVYKYSVSYHIYFFNRNLSILQVEDGTKDE